MKKPKRLEDARGQKFEEIEDVVRFTYVPATKRPTAKNWAKRDVIRVQSYVGARGGRLHRGAEVPADGAEGLLEIIRALTRLYERIDRGD